MRIADPQPRGKVDLEGRAAAELGADGDVAAQPAGERADMGKPNALARAVLGTRPAEQLEDALAVLLGEDGSGEVSESRSLLVLLDLNLPDMTGVDILVKVKANKHTRRSPVIILTTTDDEREIKRCYDLGANVYITKPVNYESFANAIQQLGLFLSVMQVPVTD